jgi:TRAP-type uncharacterized transport system fused permease subunit
MTGGPGFVAVLSSGLTGTISGSAVANTASTGVITIPLMKRAGFPATFAGGVEAAASTGGQLMPPIMGAGAFVMATYTQIPTPPSSPSRSCRRCSISSPSASSCASRRSARTPRRSPTSDGPDLWTVFRNGGPSFLVPVALLIVLLVRGFTPTYAAGYAIIAVHRRSWLTPNRMGPAASSRRLNWARAT